MALTIDEVFAQWQPPSGYDQTFAITTIVITQEDGHTSWGQAYFTVDPTAKVVSRGMDEDPENDFIARFNDDEWTRLGQRQGVQITQAGPGICSLLIILKEWENAQIELPVQLIPGYPYLGKIYQGWGDTIAGGSGRALYCLTFNEVATVRIT
jgi:hypothetical protein